METEKILAMSDDELMRWTLSAHADSHVYKIGQTVLDMRVAVKMLEANREMVEQTKERLQANIRLDATTKELATETQHLVQATRRIAFATWGVVVITLITNAGLIYLAATH